MWDELPQDVADELKDKDFISRVHYSRATYAEGCHGPLCRKAERDRGRRRTESRARNKGREYVPNHSIRGGTERDELLDRIIAWHRWDFERIKLEKRFGEQPADDLAETG